MPAASAPAGGAAAAAAAEVPAEVSPNESNELRRPGTQADRLCLRI